ncbi:type IV toxin-antitoxin system AbiEi family antitoxin domain-containing protein [Schumannella luteola]|uniref:Very-short-patch-repair endonuclease n=1 Tax=Schumannella luteola TaxID=472059 RepID=A0A852YLP7_9MICO|nr:hypothetical protein [Schumannella luteola]NYG98669.1 very-short-patch-repair endonuclease [Schumannella luteola]TPW91170.1 hypothetical protein FJ656_36120 [Schumannella luteola]
MDAVTRGELIATGLTGDRIAHEVHVGRLIRVRRGHYARPDDEADMIRAVRVGGRLACVSELRSRGIWVLDDGRLHVQVEPSRSRLRTPDDRFQRMADGGDRVDCKVHWTLLHRPESATASHVGLVDALIMSSRCLEPPAFLASLDSAVETRQLSRRDLGTVLASIPMTVGRQLSPVDGRAESGIETVVRDLALALGFDLRIQVDYAGIGRADLVIEGWIVVETDGHEHHHRESDVASDRRRDLLHAQAGRATLRFRYGQVIYSRRAIALALIAAVRTHRRVPGARAKADRALRRLERLALADS